MAMYAMVYLDDSLFRRFSESGVFSPFWKGELPRPHSRDEATDIYGELMVSLASRTDEGQRRLWRYLAGFHPSAYLDLRLDKGRATEEKGEVIQAGIDLAASCPGNCAVVFEDEDVVFRRLDGKTLVARWARDQWAGANWDRLGEYDLVDRIEVGDE